MLQEYRKYQPTGFDRKGAFAWTLEEQHGWYVAPVGQNRDSGTLETSNFEVVSKSFEALDPEEECFQIHRFGHWACGWYEIILVRPMSLCHAKALEWSEALDDYPIADEEHHSELEWNTAAEYWESMSLSERIDTCERHRISIFAARRDELPEDDGTTDFIHYLADGN